MHRTPPCGPRVSRRGFVAGAAALATLRPSPSPARSGDGDRTAFFVVGDTHFLADADAPDRLDARSAAMTGALVDTLNRLVGTEIPDAAGGGCVREPCGVIHAGDVIDTGDKQGDGAARMQATEIAAFERVMGLTGGDGALGWPVYEVHGNHDSPRAEGVAIERIVARNRVRPGVRRVSPDGLHYSWDSGPLHFVHLGIVVGGVPGLARRRRYAPRGSLDFLRDDLALEVGQSGRPVILVHHVDIARYTEPVPDDAPFADKEWDPADVGGFHAALEGYEVAAIFHGHTHARAVWRWDGSSVRPGPAGSLEEHDVDADDRAGSDAAARSIRDVFNCDNSSHFGGPAQAFFYVEAGPDGLVVREFATRDGWKTGAWSPLSWSRAAVGARV